MKKMNLKKVFIGPTDEALNDFFNNYKDKEKIAMVNLLKFKPTSDYTGIEVAEIQKDSTGKETYEHYLKLAGNIFKETKAGRILYYGESQSFLIGPENEKWDAVLLVEYKSTDSFLSFIQSDAYQKISGHRTASIEDSRLLPTAEYGIFKTPK